MLDPELGTAIRQIKGAQQNGFITFYNKTFHYVYTRAKYLFPSLMECLGIYQAGLSFLLLTYRGAHARHRPGKMAVQTPAVPLPQASCGKQHRRVRASGKQRGLLCVLRSRCGISSRMHGS